MDPIFLLLLAAVAFLAFALLLRPRTRRPALPYTKRPSLLSPAEMRFYRVLLAAIPPNLIVMVKIRLMDVLTVPDSAWQEHGAKGSGMHCDFVLACADTMAPVLVIELDDRSHWRADAKERDQFKDAALDSAGMPILRVTAAGRYDVSDIRKRILAAR